MWTDRMRVLDDVTPADWIAPRLGGSFGAVGRTVPRGFPAYARVLHPAGGENDQPARWSEVAALTRRQVHATAQWHALVWSADPWNTHDGRWPYGPPLCGNLHVDALVALCDVLGRHTATAEDSYFCLWEGWGQLQGSPAVARSGSDEHVPSVLTDDERRAPRVCLPGRDYLLMHGPLAATEDMARYDGAAWWTQSPNLFWPADHAWCVATEIDFDSTLVGGSIELITAVLRSPDLEAWPIRSDDSVASNADYVNPVNPGSP